MEAKNASDLLNNFNLAAKGLAGLSDCLKEIANALPENDEQKAILNAHLSNVERDLKKASDKIANAVKD
jgi:predicted transcriptional regulator